MVNPSNRLKNQFFVNSHNALNLYNYIIYNVYKFGLFILFVSATKKSRSFTILDDSNR